MKADRRATEREPLLPQQAPQQARSEDGYLSDLDPSAHRHFFDRPVPATANPVAIDTHRRLEYRNELRHHPDRGAGYYEYSRARNTRASLVETGRHAGRSRVRVSGFRRTLMGYHFWKRDFFTSCINLRLSVAVSMMFFAYTLSFMSWGFGWWLLYMYDRSCLIGFDDTISGNSYISAFLFATETQQTIGFGARAPADCWISTWMVVFQSVWGQLLDAVVLGVIFARISHPKQRSRTIFISDSAVIARRDGQLKLMFRIGDIRQSTCTAPSVKGALYLWGQGHTTAEGEHIPVRVEHIEFEYPQHLELLLPMVIEHNVDERSPLYGHTHESLTALGAEVVVTFEGTSESGDGFMARQSYLPDEIHWGFVFAPIIKRAPHSATRHIIDISRFHDIEPQRELAVGPPGRLSSKVVAPPRRTVPYPCLTHNTLVLSDLLLLAPLDHKLYLQIRVGDTYPNNMLEVHIRAYIYRWRSRVTAEGDVLPFEVRQLQLGNETGEDRLLLRLPIIVRHEINAASPLAAWADGKAALANDADSEIVVMVEGVQYSSGRSMMRQRTYHVHSDVRANLRFAPCVTRPQQSPDGRPLVTWARFHDTLPLSRGSAEDLRAEARGEAGGNTERAGRSGRDQQAEGVDLRPLPMPFGSVIDSLAGSGRRSRLSWGNLTELPDAVGPPQQPPQRRVPPEEDTHLSGTLTIGSGRGDWRQKRSLFNLNFDADSGDDGSTRSGPASDR